jgi:hypothetical protein
MKYRGGLHMLKALRMSTLAAVALLAGCSPTPNYLSCSNPQSTGTWPFDMKWCQLDQDNGWQLNPGYFGGPFQDPLTTTIKNQQPQGFAHDVSYTSGTWCGPFMVYSQTVIFTGSIYWGDHSNDDDYNMDLLTPWFAGASVQAQTKWGNIPLLHLEFDSDETIDHYDGNPWWKSFHDAVDNNSCVQDACNIVDGHKAIVIGRWVMDCEHNCNPEVHPVLGLAIQPQPTPSGSGVEEWHFFLRGRGDQGWCGSDDVEGIWADTVFRFPGRPGPAQASVFNVRVDDQRVTESLGWDGDDLLLTGHLPYTDDWIVGTVRITYQ